MYLSNSVTLNLGTFLFCFFHLILGYKKPFTVKALLINAKYIIHIGNSIVNSGALLSYNVKSFFVHPRFSGENPLITIDSEPRDSYLCIDSIIKGLLVIILQDSLQIIPNAYIDSSVKDAKFLDKFQFERIGFFSVDLDTTSSKVCDLKSILNYILIKQYHIYMRQNK